MTTTVSPAEAREAICSTVLDRRMSRAATSSLRRSAASCSASKRSPAGAFSGATAAPDDLVGHGERVGEVLLKDGAPAGRRARLEDGDELPGP